METFEVINRGVVYRLEETEEGGYFAAVPDLPGCLSEGKTLDEALANIREALELYVEASLAVGIEVRARPLAASSRALHGR